MRELDEQKQAQLAQEVSIEVAIDTWLKSSRAEIENKYTQKKYETPARKILSRVRSKDLVLHSQVTTDALDDAMASESENPDDRMRTVAEQQAIVRAVQHNGVIWQTGSWQRSLPSFHKAAEIVRNGLIGNVIRVEVGLPGGHHDFPGTVPALLQRLSSLPDKITSPAELVPGTAGWNLAVTEPPPELDYDMWLGPSKTEPYIDARPPELALELQHWRRTAIGLGWPPR